MEKEVKVCTGKACSEKMSKYILARLKADVDFYGYKNREIVPSLCMWKCEFWPNICIDGEIFSEQNPVKASELLRKKTKNL